MASLTELTSLTDPRKGTDETQHGTELTSLTDPRKAGPVGGLQMLPRADLWPLPPALTPLVVLVLGPALRRVALVMLPTFALAGGGRHGASARAPHLRELALELMPCARRLETQPDLIAACVVKRRDRVRLAVDLCAVMLLKVTGTEDFSLATACQLACMHNCRERVARSQSRGWRLSGHPRRRADDGALRCLRTRRRVRRMGVLLGGRREGCGGGRHGGDEGIGAQMPFPPVAACSLLERLVEDAQPVEPRDRRLYWHAY